MELFELIKRSRVDHVLLRVPHKSTLRGTLVLTGHHLIVSDAANAKAEHFQLPLRAVDLVETRRTGAYITLLLRCKNFLTYEVQLSGEDAARDVQQSIEALSHVRSLAHHLAFDYKPHFKAVEDGWSAFSLDNDVAHLGGDMTLWRVCRANHDFRLCASYPEQVLVPRSVSDEAVTAAARFRQGGRFPVLSYLHRDKGTALLRAAQPLCGVGAASQAARRCREDEALLNAVLAQGCAGLLVDTRPAATLAALNKKGGGGSGGSSGIGGTEPDLHYPRWRRPAWAAALALERPAGLQQSFARLVETCAEPAASTDKWLGRLEASRWLDHVQTLLSLSARVARALDQEAACVLVHGAEGTDTTLQLSALAQVLLEPDCRTLRGFQALVDREWLQAGHPFGSRCAHGPFARSVDRREAPVFLLFLDAVWQLWQQFPCSFEFSDKFLLLLAEQPYFSELGTFLCDSAKERRDAQLAERTTSLWTFVNRPGQLDALTNALYESPGAGRRYVLWPSTAPQSLRLWTELYARQALDLAPGEQLRRDEATRLRQENMALQSRASKLRSTLLALQEQAVARGLLAAPCALAADLEAVAVTDG